MIPENKFTAPITYPCSLSKHILLGAGIGLFLIILFLSGVNESSPAWHRLWVLKPLGIVPLSGAIGGSFIYLLNFSPVGRTWKKLLVNVLSLLIYITGLWMGFVLGLDQTFGINPSISI